MADIGPYLLALVTAVIAGVGGYVTRALATNAGARTAARLVHAELLQNSVSVAYYRETGRLLAPSLRRTAWDANSEALARLREPDAFTEIGESYQALEGIALLAKAGGEQIAEDLREFLDEAIGRLVAGLRTCAREAGLAPDVIEAEVRGLDPTCRSTPAVATSADDSPYKVLLIPAYLADRPRRLATVSTRNTTLLAVGADLERAQLAWPHRELRGQPRRLILDGGHMLARDKKDVTGTVVRREGEPDTGDPAVDEAYDALGVTYDFFYGEYDLDSYDGQGAELQAVVHYGQQYTNGFWDGVHIVYGDGDDRVYRRFTHSLDLTAYWFSLAAVERFVPLEFASQSGALKASLADVFGIQVKQYRLAQTAEEADWLIGDDLFQPGTGIRAVRSLRDPGTAYDSDPQASHMSGYMHTKEDNGEVFLNSGIPSRAFVLTALALGGYAWGTAGHIWYAAVKDPKLTPRSGFLDFAAATARAAGVHAEAVTDAWEGVGVTMAVRSG